jgi:tRNA modification GTPase
MPKNNLKSIETIAAPATPPGRGGVAVVRVSGSKVRDIAKSILGREIPPRQACYHSFQNEKNEVIDMGIALFFPAPHSFTGDDVLELHGHGGPVVVDLLMQRILKLGARLAKPGEFSERAFLNHKIDLTQAEAIADLIDASSSQAARSAVRSLQGEFSKTINEINQKIIHLRLFVESAIDFTDEEIDFISDDKIRIDLEEIIHQVKNIQQNAKQGVLLREGITVVISGKPNVGKSSLLNRLSGKELAIVTDIPGTTRDVLRNYISLKGIPVHIIDTAGLRESTDPIEQEGIKRARSEMESADLILFLSDAANESTDATDLSLSLLTCPVIFVHNKIDLIKTNPKCEKIDNHISIHLSAKTGAGVGLLEAQILDCIGYHTGEESPHLARRRHLDALSRALELLEQGLEQSSRHRFSELLAEDLRLAHKSLCEITGEFTSDDLLGAIFSTFCIGK